MGAGDSTHWLFLSLTVSLAFECVTCEYLMIRLCAILCGHTHNAQQIQVQTLPFAFSNSSFSRSVARVALTNKCIDIVCEHPHAAHY